MTALTSTAVSMDSMFQKALGSLPAELREATQASEIADAGLLLVHPRTHWKVLGLRAGTRTSTRALSQTNTVSSCVSPCFSCPPAPSPCFPSSLTPLPSLSASSSWSQSVLLTGVEGKATGLPPGQLLEDEVRAGATTGADAEEVEGFHGECGGGGGMDTTTLGDTGLSGASGTGLNDVEEEVLSGSGVACIGEKIDVGEISAVRDGFTSIAEHRDGRYTPDPEEWLLQQSGFLDHEKRKHKERQVEQQTSAQFQWASERP